MSLADPSGAAAVLAWDDRRSDALTRQSKSLSRPDKSPLT